jgi:hypothetical protein
MNQYFLPKTNNKNCIGTMNFISILPLLPLRISSPPTPGRGGSRWHIANIPPLVVGGDGLAVRQNPHSSSPTNPGQGSSWPLLSPALDIWFLPGERLHWQQAVGNEGAIRLTHRSCFRVAAAPMLATREAMICRIMLDDLLFLRQEDRGEGRTSRGTWCTCCGNEKCRPPSMGLTLSVRGAQQ